MTNDNAQQRQILSEDVMQEDCGFGIEGYFSSGQNPFAFEVEKYAGDSEATAPEFALNVNSWPFEIENVSGSESTEIQSKLKVNTLKPELCSSVNSTPVSAGRDPISNRGSLTQGSSCSLLEELGVRPQLIAETQVLPNSQSLHQKRSRITDRAESEYKTNPGLIKPAIPGNNESGFLTTLSRRNEGVDLSSRLAALIRKKTTMCQPQHPHSSGNISVMKFQPSVSSSINVAPSIPRFSMDREAILTSLGVDTLQSSVASLPRNESWGCKQLVKQSVPPQVLRNMILTYAEAVAMDDEYRASMLRPLILSETSLKGTPLQRVTRLFLEALDARSAGKGLGLYERGIVLGNRELTILWNFVGHLPVLQFFMEGLVGGLYEAVAGLKNIHFIDFGMWAGQWPQLIRQLARQPGGAPSLRLTVIAPPPGSPAGLGPSMGADMFETAIQAAAVESGVDLEYRAVVSRLEDLSAALVGVREGEAVAVNCAMQLSQVMDNSALRWNPRECVLRFLRDVNPVVATQGELNLDSNGPFFLERVRGSYDLYRRLFELHEGLPGAGQEGRAVFESSVMGREILNLVSCEGAHRVARHCRVDTWRKRMWEVGMAPKRLSRNLAGFIGGSAARRNAELAVNGDEAGVLELTLRGHGLASVMTWQPLQRLLSQQSL